MKPTQYDIDFGDATVVVDAFGALEASILACSERIRSGLHCNMKRIVCESGRTIEPNHPNRQCIALALIPDSPL